ncbi:MAG: hypothetical protein SOT08_00820 [Candidatus Borkfalkiaceae bacterium]|nr:hypothetical protein [Christensenellaceae bacterium]
MKTAKNNKIKQPASQKAVFCVAFVIFCVYAAFILFFFVFAFLIAIKENNRAFLEDQIAAKLFSFPAKPTLKHFIEAFTEWTVIDGETSYITMFFNSVWISILGPLISAFTTASVTYVLVFYRTGYTKWLYKLGVFFAILPLYGASGAMYKLVTDIGIIDSPLMFLTNISLFGGNFFYYYAFYKAISWQYAEAAFIDGASHWQVYLKIMLPMLIPSATALYVMSVISTWNDYANIILYWQSFPTLAYGAYAYSEIAKYNANNPAYFAGVLISIVPILVLFACFQNTIMEKVHIGGLKG